mgnify:CR=1 FL=1
MASKHKLLLMLPEGVRENEVMSYCKSCKEESRELSMPSPKAMDCWKIIIESNIEYMDLVIGIVKDYINMYKECWAQYRVLDDKIFILINCRGWRNMWEFRSRLIDYLMKHGIIDKPYLPYRRGGSYYDKDYGPWRLWARDYYTDRLPIADMVHARSICPFDGAIMEFTGKGLKCGLCGLFVPETLLYEAVENGIAEYVPKQGFYRDKVFILRYVGSDRFIVEPKKC